MADYADVSISIIFIAKSEFIFSVSPRLLAGDSRLTISNSPTYHFISCAKELESWRTRFVCYPETRVRCQAISICPALSVWKTFPHGGRKWNKVGRFCGSVFLLSSVGRTLSSRSQASLFLVPLLFLSIVSENKPPFGGL